MGFVVYSVFEWIAGCFEAAQARAAQSSFRTDERGAITVIFALTIIPILGVIALSLDYGRASDAELTIQRAADAAILSAQRISPAPREKLKSSFEANFRANLPKKYKSATSEVRFKGDMTSMSAIVTYTMNTAFMVIVGKPTFTVAVQTAAKLRTLPAGLPVAGARGRRKPPTRTTGRNTPSNANARRIRDLLRQKIEEARNRAPANPQVQRMLEQMSRQLGR